MLVKSIVFPPPGGPTNILPIGNLGTTSLYFDCFQLYYFNCIGVVSGATDILNLIHIIKIIMGIVIFKYKNPQEVRCQN